MPKNFTKYITYLWRYNSYVFFDTNFVEMLLRLGFIHENFFQNLLE